MAGKKKSGGARANKAKEEPKPSRPVSVVIEVKGPKEAKKAARAAKVDKVAKAAKAAKAAKVDKAAKKASKASKAAKASKAGKAPKVTALQKNRAALLSLRDIASPQIPIDRLIGEGRVLLKASRKDRKALLKVGLDPAVLEGLDGRIETLAEAQARYQAETRKTRGREELEKEREAYMLRADMLADARWAFRNEAGLLDALARIQEGEGLDDLVQDLRDLAALFHAQRHLFAAVDAEALAERAQDVAISLGDLVATRREETTDEKDLRDRAASWLKDAMSDIRAAGQYALRKDPARLALYASVDVRRKNGRSKQTRSRSKAAPAKAGPAAPSGPSKPQNT